MTPMTCFRADSCIYTWDSAHKHRPDRSTARRTLRSPPIPVVSLYINTHNALRRRPRLYSADTGEHTRHAQPTYIHTCAPSTKNPQHKTLCQLIIDRSKYFVVDACPRNAEINYDFNTCIEGGLIYCAANLTRSRFRVLTEARYSAPRNGTPAHSTVMLSF